jgi:magnesium transporter
MFACAYREGEPLRRDLGIEEVRAAVAAGDALLWVDIETDGRHEAEDVLQDVFHFHPLTIDDCFNTLIDPPKIDDYGDYLFVIIHDVRYDPAEKRLWTAELNMYIGRNYVVTVHRYPVHAVQEVRRRAEAEAPVLHKGVDFLAHALFDVVVDDMHPIVEALDEQVSDIEDEVLQRPEPSVLEDVLRLKRISQRVRRSILPQRDVATRLSRGEYPRLLSGQSLMYFRDVYDHTVRVEEMIDSVRDLADSTLNTYLSSVNNRTNEVMKTLAIATVVFLPLSLIAGIYGTNFENVFEYELGRAGYFGMWVVMIVVALGTLAYFRWRKWI